MYCPTGVAHETEIGFVLKKYRKNLNQLNPTNALLWTPSRFSEWSFAAWEFQKEFLVQPEGCAFDISFLAVYHQDDHKHMLACKETIAGRVMTQWWDTSDDAGPTTRPASRFEESPPNLEVLVLADDELKSLGKDINK